MGQSAHSRKMQRQRDWRRETHGSGQVSQRRESIWSLDDLCGNTWEWCSTLTAPARRELREAPSRAPFSAAPLLRSMMHPRTCSMMTPALMRYSGRNHASSSQPEQVIASASPLDSTRGPSRGSAPAAGYWSDKAMEWAQEAGDSLLVAYILMRKSNQASDSLDPGRTLGLALAAERALTGMPSKVHALTLRQQAHGFALLREEADCQRVLEQAHACVDERNRNPEPREPLADYCTPEYIDAEATSCWVHLGRPNRAIDLLSPAIAPDAVSSRRDQGLPARSARSGPRCGRPPGSSLRRRLHGADDRSTRPLPASSQRALAPQDVDLLGWLSRGRP